MMQCRDIDELMMDFLYQELDASRAAAFQSHVGGCSRCNAELASLQRTRTAVRALPELDPPAAVTARLMHEAAKRAPRPAEERGGLLGWLGALWRPVAMHPAFAAVAALVLIGGVAGYLQMRGVVSEKPAPERSIATAGEEARDAAKVAAEEEGLANRQQAAADVPSGGAAAPMAAPASDNGPDDSYHYGRFEDEAAAGDRVGRLAGKPAMADPGVLGSTGRAPARSAPAPDENRGGEDGLAEKQRGDGERAELEKKKAVTRAPAAPAPTQKAPSTTTATPLEEPPGGVTDQRAGAGGGVVGRGAASGAEVDDAAGAAREAPAKPARAPASKPAEQAPSGRDRRAAETESVNDDEDTGARARAPAPPPPSEPAAGKKPETKPSDADSPQNLHKQAKKSASSGDCANVTRLKGRIQRMDPKYYEQRVARDPELKCEERRAKQREDAREPARETPAPPAAADKPASNN